MPQFTHLHSHTQYSLLDGASKIPAMLDKCKADGMTACAITDHGNMFGVFEFVAECNKRDLSPIVGCEFYLVEDRHQKEFKGGKRDKRYHQLLLAKNEIGYQNISKLCSLGYIEGMYSKWPRIDKELLEKYHEGLIATSCCIGAEIPQAILHEGAEAAEEKFKWWLDLFGEDYYIEIQRHQIPNIDGSGMSQEDVNQVLLRWATKYNVKAIATNDSHYIDKEDYDAHDILLCVNTGELKSTPVGKGERVEKNERFGFFNDEFYFKSQEEMNKLFSDVPEAIANTQEIVDKVSTPNIARDVLLPNFPLPTGFSNENDYLRHLTYEGAAKRYDEITPSITERLEHELNVIKTMGFAGYFLIVQDFIDVGKKEGVWVGPGRGSAAGSAVAYCIGITNVDPIRYNLLFERFLNPERVSMPDIDIDFDDEGRQKVIDYVVRQYGQNQVAQIVTFGTMAARSAIRDVSRVMDYPLPETDKLAKLVPGRPGTTLSSAFDEIKELKEIRSGKGVKEEHDILVNAEKLEGTVRHTGIHAAGVIIAPDDLTKYIPVCTAKDAELWVTQFEGKYIENAGMLKMDFLGLKTLSILKDAIENVKLRHGKEIDVDEIPLDDEKTYELFQRGDTIAIFQFESDGMRKHLKTLKPDNIEHLIAMNALYRPGPMDYIPNFIRRRHGKEKVEYPHEMLEELLKPTYGIMVYQEQIMECAKIIGGYTLGGADLLRRAMGKKKVEEMERQREIFIKGAGEKNIEKEKAKEIFEIMAKFAGYGFNRSHSAAYAILAYKTAYLKAHYPAEFMASVLTHNMGNIDQITFFLNECNSLGVKALGPDVNESRRKFVVNANGEIRFGLNAVKGVGEAAVDALVEERDENGPYQSIFDLTSRVNLRSVNKKCLESLAYAGAFDSFDLYRSQYFYQYPKEQMTVLEKAVKYGGSVQTQQSSMENSLFGDVELEAPPEPVVPPGEPWPLMEMLKHEKAVTGIYVSGHPLDDYRNEMKWFPTCPIDKVDQYLNRSEIKLGGLIVGVNERVSQKGRKYAQFQLQDFTGELNMGLYNEKYIEMNGYVKDTSQPVLITGTYKQREKDGEKSFWISKIELLASAAEKLTKQVTLNIDTGRVNDQMIQKVEELCESNPGDLPIRFNLVDTRNQTKVEMLCRRFKIKVSKELTEALDSIEGLGWRLN